MIRYDALSKSRQAQEKYDPHKRAAQQARAARNTGYLHDAQAHENARNLVPAERRSAIASMGGQARAATYGHTPASPYPAFRAAIEAARADSITVVPREAPPAKRSPAQIKAAAAARAAASRPARRAAARAQKAADQAAITKALRS
jgi:hypothetical protein